jgi:uncharacterized membrane protein YidH (DUF202 family)
VAAFSRQEHRTTISETSMKVGTLFGLILIVLGIVGVAYGGITYTRRREIARVGPLQVTAREERTIPISPILGGVAIVAGVALIVAVKRAS